MAKISKWFVSGDSIDQFMTFSVVTDLRLCSSYQITTDEYGNLSQETIKFAIAGYDIANLRTFSGRHLLPLIPKNKATHIPDRIPIQTKKITRFSSRKIHVHSDHIWWTLGPALGLCSLVPQRHPSTFAFQRRNHNCRRNGFEDG